MNQEVLVTLQHPADYGGCGHYRMEFPSWLTHTLRRDLRIVSSIKLFDKPDFYKNIRLVRVQRQITNDQANYLLNFLSPLSQRLGFWICYEIDDVIGMNDIPKYNSGWSAYQNVQLMENIKQIFKVVDIVTLTTQKLADYYIKNFGLDKEKVFVIPNYLPKWWIGDSYNLDKISYRYAELTSRKPRVGFVCSLTHFDMSNKNNGNDDLTPYISWIKDNIDKYQFVFVGGHPLQLTDEINKNKIEFYHGFDLLNYPRMVNNLKLDVAVAPIQDNTFNNCKSNIKVIEMGSLGIPVLCQKLTPYFGFSEHLFSDANSLDNKISEVLKTKETYLDTVRYYKNIVDNGNSYSPNGWWLENNMDKWFSLYGIQQKTLRFDLTRTQNQQPSNQQNIDLTQNIKTFKV